MNTRIAVVMGGPSAEHEISLRSGREVLLHMDAAEGQRRAVVISRSKKFYWCDVDGNVPSLDELTSPKAPRFHGPVSAADAGPMWDGCSLAFLVTHGEFGEDGVLQGYLETIGMPYTGSGVYASAVAMNKITTKVLFERAGITTPPYSLYGKAHPMTTVEAIAAKHGFPCFCKCPQSGSSRLMGRADNFAGLQTLLADLGQSADEVLVETAISGVEFSCGVIEDPDGSVRALPPVEIRPKTPYFDFAAKYTDNATEEIVPAPRPEQLLHRVMDVALAAHRVTGCRGYSRTDVIQSGDALHVLEINTLPGMTSNSLLPKEFISEGGTFAQLISLMIETALARGLQAP